MSTNYYFVPKKKEIDRIKRELIELGYGFLVELGSVDCVGSTIHIGKKSAGWMFNFQKTDYYSNLKELKDFYYRNKKIFGVQDEYDREVELETVLKIAEDSKKDKTNRSHFHEVNIAKLNNENYPWDDGSYLDSEGYCFIEQDFS